MKINGIKEIAEAAGCSCSTVSRVLNNRNGISEATRQKIISIAEKLDYANKRKKRIVAVFCFLDSDGYDAYSMHLLRQVVLALHNAGFYAEVLFNENIEIVGEHYICGAVSIQISVEGIPELWGKKYKLPMVCVNDRDNLPEDIHSVVSDDRLAISNAVQWLYEIGHRSIYLLTVKIQENNFSDETRLKAFEEKIKGLGIESDCGVCFTRNRFRSTLPVDTYIKKIPKNCTAVINLIEDSAYNFGVRLKALRPDVTFITYSYPWQQDVLSMGFPCIVHDFNTLTRKTVQLLKDQLEGRQIRSQRIPFIFKIPASMKKNGE